MESEHLLHHKLFLVTAMDILMLKNAGGGGADPSSMQIFSTLITLRKERKSVLKRRGAFTIVVKFHPKLS